MKISIIVPVFNEENFIKEILERIKKINLDLQIIVVNDGSDDNTRNILLENKFLYDDFVDLVKNTGKGNAIHEGIKKINGEIVLIQDADLEYDPSDYYKLLDPFKDENIHCVYGSRVLPGANRTRPKSLSFAFRTFANHFRTFLSNLLNNQKLTDAHTCYKVFRKDIFFKLRLKERGFAFCPEVTTKISNMRCPIVEVPISYKGREIKDGKKIRFTDAISALITIIKYKYFNSF